MCNNHAVVYQQNNNNKQMKPVINQLTFLNSKLWAPTISQNFIANSTIGFNLSEVLVSSTNENYRNKKLLTFGW